MSRCSECGAKLAKGYDICGCERHDSFKGVWRQWHPTKGAFIRSEVERVDREFRAEPGHLSTHLFTVVKRLAPELDIADRHALYMLLRYQYGGPHGRRK